MSSYQMGKQAALAEFGLIKEAGPLSWFMKLIGRGAKAAPKAARGATRGAAKTTAQTAARGAASKTVRPKASATANVSVKPPRKKPAPKTPPAAAGTEQPPQNAGMLSNIPWWGKALGAGALGYGAYRMMSPSEPEPQGIQPYFGPGNAAVDQRGMYQGF